MGIRVAPCNYQRRGRGGGVENVLIGQILYLTSYLQNFIFFTLCLNQTINFTFLDFLSTNKIVSKTRPSIDLEFKAQNICIRQ